MVDEFRTQLKNYFKDWQLIVDERVNSEFFTALKPTALGWKFTDRDEAMARFAEIRDLCDQVHFGWIDERRSARATFAGSLPLPQLLDD